MAAGAELMEEKERGRLPITRMVLFGTIVREMASRIEHTESS
jgi:hypothetical protein